MATNIFDSHIHLWGSWAANDEHHGWMQAGSHLAKQYSMAQYHDAAVSAIESKPYHVMGFIYVETDRRVKSSSNATAAEKPEIYALRHIQEMRFLRRLVQGTPEPGDGFKASDGDLLKGIVAWAPIDRGIHAFREYVTAIAEAAGAETWERVKGFRFLIQGIKYPQEFRRLVDDEKIHEVLRSFGNKWCFDVGVDQRQGGVWQLEMVEELIRRVLKGGSEVTFVLNHLCKPDMEHDLDSTNRRIQFERWKSLMERFAQYDRVFMKLSGAFSEIGDQDPTRPWTVDAIVNRIMPWIQHIIDTFTPQRIMFGSDWPVCNVRGPGDDVSWNHWRTVVQEIMRRAKLTDREQNLIWSGTAIEAYRIKM